MHVRAEKGNLEEEEEEADEGTRGGVGELYSSFYIQSINCRSCAFFARRSQDLGI